MLKKKKKNLSHSHSSLAIFPLRSKQPILSCADYKKQCEHYRLLGQAACVYSHLSTHATSPSTGVTSGSGPQHCVSEGRALVSQHDSGSSIVLRRSELLKLDQAPCALPVTRTTVLWDGPAQRPAEQTSRWELAHKTAHTCVQVWSAKTSHYDRKAPLQNVKFVPL